MTSTFYRLVPLVVVSISLSVFGSAFRIIQDPPSFNEETDKVNLTCVTDGHAYWAKTVVGIVVSKQDDNNKVIASIHDGQQVLGPGSAENMQVNGHIDADASKSFLTLVIDHPTIKDAGSYKCQVFYFNEDYKIMNENVTANITYQEQDIADIVLSLARKVSNLTTTVQIQREVNLKLNQRVEELEKENVQQNNKIQSLENGDQVMKHLMSIQNETIDGQNKKLNEMKDDLTKQERQLEDLGDLMTIQNDTIVRQNEKLEVLENLTKDQNETIQRLEKRLMIMRRNCACDNETVPACLDGWTYYHADETCLKTFARIDPLERLNWDMARKSCQGFGGDLVALKDEKKNAFVLEMFAGGSYGPWIGVRNMAKVGFQFEYVDQTKMGDFHPWVRTEPSGDKDGDHKCVFLDTNTRYTGQWWDGTCSYTRPYVCSTPSNNGTGVF